MGGLRSALDTKEIRSGRHIAATGAFNPVLGKQQLTFAAGGCAAFIDRQTGSTRDILSRTVTGPLALQRLPPVSHLDTFWFAWAAFHPDTRLVMP